MTTIIIITIKYDYETIMIYSTGEDWIPIGSHVLFCTMYSQHIKTDINRNFCSLFVVDLLLTNR